MIQGLSALLPILNKAVSLVPDKNKIAQQKADLEKELVKALVDVDKEQAKINRKIVNSKTEVLSPDTNMHLEK